MKKITMKNIGPIKEATVDPLEGGGIIRFVGGQGCGKSTALAAISKRLSGQDTAIDLTPRDGTNRGELWIGGAKLTVTRGRKALKGELEVQHIEGKFDISRLCEPGIKDPIAADQARIKALIALSGATASPSDFYAAVGGQKAFDGLAIDCDVTDPVVLAGRISRALHATARKLEKKATAEFAAAQVKQREADGVDKTCESDRDVLQSAYDGTHALVAELGVKRSQYTGQQAAVATAYQSLEALEPPLVSIHDARKSVADHEFSLAATLKEIDKARADLARAESELKLRKANVGHAQQVIKLAITHEETVVGLKEIIASAQLEPVADDTLAAAERAMALAGLGIELGVVVRAAEAAGLAAAHHLLVAETHQQSAVVLRDRSQSVDEILSGLIPTSNLRIDEGRIVTKTDRSNSELFAELSDGERAALAIDVTVPNLPEDGLLIAPQWMWEGWTKSMREMVYGKLKEHGVMMLTAEARDGELAVEVYEVEKR